MHESVMNVIATSHLWILYGRVIWMLYAQFPYKYPSKVAYECSRHESVMNVIQKSHMIVTWTSRLPKSLINVYEKSLMNVICTSQLWMWYARVSYGCHMHESLMNVLGTSHLWILYGRVIWMLHGRVAYKCLWKVTYAVLKPSWEPSGCRTRQPGRTWLLGPGECSGTNPEYPFCSNYWYKSNKRGVRGPKHASKKLVVWNVTFTS